MIVEEWFLLVCHFPTPTPIATAVTTTNATIMRIDQITGLEAARSVGYFQRLFDVNGNLKHRVFNKVNATLDQGEPMVHNQTRNLITYNYIPQVQDSFHQAQTPSHYSLVLELWQSYRARRAPTWNSALVFSSAASGFNNALFAQLETVGKNLFRII